MKLLRYGEPGHELPGVLDDDGNVRCLSSVVDDIDGPALAGGRLTDIVPSRLRRVTEVSRLGSCVGNVGKFIGVGLNYADHAEESGAPIPAEPEIFTKATSSICGPNDNIVQPRGSEKLDWEVELAVIVGRHAAYVSEADADQYIAGYCICNDVSERDFQFERGKQWDKGKGCDTFGPIGPWLVTPDEVADPLNLNLWLEVNGRRYQDSNTRSMVFGPAFIVSYLSRFMSLHPGDVITTGTPPGVGMAQKPPAYLQTGDRIELGITSLGTQRQTVVAARRSSTDGD